MKIVVISGTGRIGSKSSRTCASAHGTRSRTDLNTGVNTITGDSLDSALADAQVVVDLSNSPSFEDAGFRVLPDLRAEPAQAEVNAGVEHHVALSIVGADRLPDGGYLRAKVAQEQLIEAAGQPYTIIRSTQFFEFLRAIADSATDGDTVSVPTATLQPIAAQDVAAAVTEACLTRSTVSSRSRGRPPSGFPTSSATSLTPTTTHAQWSAIRTPATSAPNSPTPRSRRTRTHACAPLLHRVARGQPPVRRRSHELTAGPARRTCRRSPGLTGHGFTTAAVA